METKNWLSIVDYARSHNVSDMTVRRWIKSGKLNATLRDGKYYISTDQIIEEPARATAMSPGAGAYALSSNVAHLPLIKSDEPPGTMSLLVEKLTSLEQQLAHLPNLEYFRQELENRDQQLARLKRKLEDLECLTNVLEDSLNIRRT